MINGVDDAIKEVCLEIEKRYELKFLEIGTDGDHIHFLVQSVPMYSISKIVTMIKSIPAKHVFKEHPEVKKHLWGGEFWSDGGYVASVGEGVNAEIIRSYIAKQGRKSEQLKLFEFS